MSPPATTATPWQLRPAKASDEAALLALHEWLYHEEAAAFLSPKLHQLAAYRDLTAVLRADMAALLRGPQSLVWVAEAPEGLLGYATARIESDTRRVLPQRAVIEDCYVQPAWRRRGIARALLKALLKACAGRGAMVVDCATWPDNAPMCALLQTLGLGAYELRLLYDTRVLSA
ncbi:MAG: GNAT family N-acetyltransferase, partial [Polyangiales bacterium]